MNRKNQTLKAIARALVRKSKENPGVWQAISDEIDVDEVVFDGVYTVGSNGDYTDYATSEDAARALAASWAADDIPDYIIYDVLDTIYDWTDSEEWLKQADNPEPGGWDGDDLFDMPLPQGFADDFREALEGKEWTFAPLWREAGIPWASWQIGDTPFTVVVSPDGHGIINCMLD